MECRVFNLPEQQYLAASVNYITNAGDSGQKDPNQRYAYLRILVLEKDASGPSSFLETECSIRELVLDNGLCSSSKYLLANT